MNLSTSVCILFLLVHSFLFLLPTFSITTSSFHANRVLSACMALYYMHAWRSSVSGWGLEKTRHPGSTEGSCLSAPEKPVSVLETPNPKRSRSRSAILPDIFKARGPRRRGPGGPGRDSPPQLVLRPQGQGRRGPSVSIPASSCWPRPRERQPARTRWPVPLPATGRLPPGTVHS